MIKRTFFALSVLAATASMAQAAPVFQTCSPLSIAQKVDSGRPGFTLECRAGDWAIKYAGQMPSGQKNRRLQYRMIVTGPDGQEESLVRTIQTSVGLLAGRLAQEAVQLDSGALALRDCEKASCTRFRVHRLKPIAAAAATAAHAPLDAALPPALAAASAPPAPAALPVGIPPVPVNPNKPVSTTAAKPAVEKPVCDQTKISVMETLLGEKSQKASELERRLEALSTTRATMEQRISEMTKEAEALKVAGQDKDRSLEDLKRQLAKAEGAAAKHAADLEALNKKLQVIESESQGLKKALADKDAQAMSGQQAKAQAVAELQAKMLSKDLALADVEKKVAQLSATLDSAKQQQAEAVARAIADTEAKFAGDLANRAKAMASVTAQLDKQIAAVTAAELELMALRDQAAKAEARAAKAEQSAATYKKALENLVQEYSKVLN